MTTKSSDFMEGCIFEARVVPQEEGYLATLEQLSIEVTGDSMETAQEILINRFRSWIEAHEEAEDLAESLAAIGMTGVGDDTELELHFVE